MGQSVWVVDVPAHDEVSLEKKYYEYNFQPFKLTLQGVEFGTIERGQEVSKAQSGLRPTVFNNMIILASMTAWAMSKGGGMASLASMAGLLKGGG